MLPLSLLAAAKSRPVLVELKNGETYNGHLIHCDNFMNINMSDVICTAPDGNRFVKMEQCYLKGNMVKYLRIPDEVIDSVLEERAFRTANRQQQQYGYHGGAHGYRQPQGFNRERTAGSYNRGGGGAGGSNSSERGLNSPANHDASTENAQDDGGSAASRGGRKPHYSQTRSYQGHNSSDAVENTQGDGYRRGGGRGGGRRGGRGDGSGSGGDYRRDYGRSNNGGSEYQGNAPHPTRRTGGGPYGGSRGGGRGHRGGEKGDNAAADFRPREGAAAIPKDN